MLLTTCPNCAAQFKVQPNQLSVGQGRVMCGKCRNIFNAFQMLARVPDPDLPVPPAKAPEGAMPHESPRHGSPEVLLPELPSRKIAPILPKVLSVEIENEKIPRRDPEPAIEYARMDRAVPQVAPAAPVALPKITLETSNSLLAQPLKNHRAEHPLVWGAGCLLLLLLMIGQSLYAFRNPILQAFPQTHLPLASMCAFLRCTLSWGRDDKAVVIESSDLIESPGEVGLYLLSAVIANRSAIAQDLPAMDVRLTDNTNQIVIRRTLLPADYLGRPPKTDENLLPNSQLFVNLNVNIDPKISASGYTYEVFYP